MQHLILIAQNTCAEVVVGLFSMFLILWILAIVARFWVWMLIDALVNGAHDRGKTALVFGRVLLISSARSFTASSASRDAGRVLCGDEVAHAWPG